MSVRIVENKENKTVTAFLSGEIDHHGAKKMREEIDKAIDESLPSLLVLDFGEVSFMDSSGIGLVMGRYKKMRDLDGKIFIQNPSMHKKRLCALRGWISLRAWATVQERECRHESFKRNEDYISVKIRKRRVRKACRGGVCLTA